MNYVFGGFQIFVNEQAVVPDVPPRDEHGWTRYRVPVSIQRGGWEGATLESMFWGSALNYREGKLPDPAEAAACIVEDILSAYNDPDEYVQMCVGDGVGADALMAIAATVKFAETQGEALWDLFEEMGAMDYEAVADFMREIGG